MQGNIGAIDQYFHRDNITGRVGELSKYVREAFDRASSYTDRIKNISPDTEAMIAETVGVCLPLATLVLTPLIFRDNLSYVHIYGACAAAVAEFVTGMKLELHSHERRKVL